MGWRPACDSAGPSRPQARSGKTTSRRSRPSRRQSAPKRGQWRSESTRMSRLATRATFAIKPASVPSSVSTVAVPPGGVEARGDPGPGQRPRDRQGTWPPKVGAHDRDCHEAQRTDRFPTRRTTQRPHDFRIKRGPPARFQLIAIEASATTRCARGQVFSHRWNDQLQPHRSHPARHKIGRTREDVDHTINNDFRIFAI